MTQAAALTALTGLSHLQLTFAACPEGPQFEGGLDLDPNQANLLAHMTGLRQLSIVDESWQFNVEGNHPGLRAVLPAWIRGWGPHLVELSLENTDLDVAATEAVLTHCKNLKRWEATVQNIHETSNLICQPLQHACLR